MTTRAEIEAARDAALNCLMTSDALLQVVGAEVQDRAGLERLIELSFDDLCRALDAAERAFAAGDVDQRLAEFAARLPVDFTSDSAHHEACACAYRIWLTVVCGSPRLRLDTAERVTRAGAAGAEHQDQISPEVLDRWIGDGVLDYRFDPQVLAGAGSEIRTALTKHPRIKFSYYHRYMRQEVAKSLREAAQSGGSGDYLRVSGRVLEKAFNIGHDHPPKVAQIARMRAGSPRSG
jgi:hypothetical protein